MLVLYQAIITRKFYRYSPNEHTQIEKYAWSMASQLLPESETTIRDG